MTKYILKIIIEFLNSLIILGKQQAKQDILIIPDSNTKYHAAKIQILCCIRYIEKFITKLCKRGVLGTCEQNCLYLSFPEHLRYSNQPFIFPGTADNN